MTPADEIPDAILDDLFSATPDTFVTVREAHAKQLRAAGDTVIAHAVHALRRPTLVVWSVNQAARNRADLVRALFSAVDELADAIASGEGDAIRVGMRTRRTLVDELTDASLEEATKLSANVATHRDAIATTWDAAAGDASVRATVAAGHLTHELTPKFEIAGDESPFATARATPTPAAPPRDELARRRAEEALSVARAELTDAAAAVAAAERELADVERAVTAARAAHRRAQSRVEKAEQTLSARRA
ncbi:MAG: hypothetical protein ABWY80_01020 [Acidimicrobiia bacterium]